MGNRSFGSLEYHVLDEIILCSDNFNCILFSSGNLNILNRPNDSSFTYVAILKYFCITYQGKMIIVKKQHSVFLQLIDRMQEYMDLRTFCF